MQPLAARSAVACAWLLQQGKVAVNPFRTRAAAVSVGIVNGHVLLDLEYAEDSVAEVDLNVVSLEAGGLVEVQGTAERAPFSHEELQKFLELGWNGIKGLVEMQRELLGDLR